MLILRGMGAAPSAPGRNAAEDQARRDAGLVGPATATCWDGSVPGPGGCPKKPGGDVLDSGGSWLSEHKLLAGGAAAALVVGFLWWRRGR